MSERDELKEALAEMLPPAGSHPGAEELVAYHEGRLSPADETRVQDHLLACRECAELLADLEGLGDPDFGAGEALRDDAGQIVWEGVRKEIAPASKVVPFRPRAPRWLQALAAVLLLSTLGLGAWVSVLVDRVQELSSPQLNAPVLDLYPSSTRGETSLSARAVPPDARLFTVILNPAGRPAHPGYGVEIADSGGTVVWQEEGLKPNPYGSFSLTLPRSTLGDGEFRVRLLGIAAGGERETVGEYVLRIEE